MWPGRRAGVWMKGAGREVGHEIVVKGAIEICMALLEGAACSNGCQAMHCCSITGKLRKWSCKIWGRSRREVPDIYPDGGDFKGYNLVFLFTFWLIASRTQIHSENVVRLLLGFLG